MDEKDVEDRVTELIAKVSKHMWDSCADMIRETGIGEGTFDNDDITSFADLPTEIRVGFIQSVAPVIQETTMAVGSIAVQLRAGGVHE